MTDDVARWSRDGKRIYFTSARSGERQIWKMPDGKNGGNGAQESPDGRSMLVTQRDYLNIDLMLVEDFH